MLIFGLWGAGLTVSGMVGKELKFLVERAHEAAQDFLWLSSDNL